MKESARESIAKWGIWEKAQTMATPPGMGPMAMPSDPTDDDESSETALLNQLMALVKQLISIQGQNSIDEEEQEMALLQQADTIIDMLCEGC